MADEITPPEKINITVNGSLVEEDADPCKKIKLERHMTPAEIAKLIDQKNAEARAKRRKP